MLFSASGVVLIFLNELLGKIEGSGNFFIPDSKHVFSNLEDRGYTEHCFQIK